MLFVAAATVGGIIIAFEAHPAERVNSTTFHFARAVSYGLINIYILKIACVFIMTTSIVAIYTALAPSWIAICGYGVAFFMLFWSYYLDWSFVLFPFWVLLLSVYILIDNLRRT
jgi:hypothetical protein